MTLKPLLFLTNLKDRIVSRLLTKKPQLTFPLPAKKKFAPWLINTKRVEIELTTRCSLACLNCDAQVRQAPSNNDMSLNQIEKFVKESIALGWRWKEISLIGGEPTLHPRFFDVLKIIKKYKTAHPECSICLETNGYGSKVNEVLSKLPDWITVFNTKKQSNVNNFSSINIAAIDVKKYKDEDFSKGCWIAQTCGLGLTRYGYYPCRAGSSVDRVFGFNVGIKKLSMVNPEKLRDKLGLLCRYCGHYKCNFNIPYTTEEKMSPSWINACKNYKKQKPKLNLY